MSDGVRKGLELVEDLGLGAVRLLGLRQDAVFRIAELSLAGVTLFESYDLSSEGCELLLNGLELSRRRAAGEKENSHYGTPQEGVGDPGRVARNQGRSGLLLAPPGDVELGAAVLRPAALVTLRARGSLFAVIEHSI